MIGLAIGIGILGFAAMRAAHRHWNDHHGHGWYGPFGEGHE